MSKFKVKEYIKLPVNGGIYKVHSVTEYYYIVDLMNSENSFHSEKITLKGGLHLWGLMYVDTHAISLGFKFAPIELLYL